jgi:hypothetical protein
VGTRKKKPGDDIQRALLRDSARGKKVPHDEPAEVPIRLDDGGHKGLTAV